MAENYPVNNIPEDLRRNGLFCLWKLEDRGGKPTKPPYNPNSPTNYAKADDLSTFSAFDKALGAYEKGGFNGIGMALCRGYCAIDIDGCFINGKLSDMAADIIKIMDTHTQVSPSGNGIRILFRADGFQYDKDRYYIKNDKKGLEIYLCGVTKRYVTITGWLLDKNKPIQERGAQLQSVLDKYMMREAVPERKHQAATEPGSMDYIKIGIEKDRVFASLYNGDRPNGNESADDLALLNKAAYWCNCNPDLMRQVFFQSPHYQQKDPAHTKKCDRKDYIRDTIARAIRDCSTTAETDHQIYQAQRIARPATKHIKVEDKNIDIMQQLQPHIRYSWDDKGMGQLFADVYKDVARYNSTAREWYFYNGKIWLMDCGGMEVARLGKELMDSLSIYAFTIEDEERKANYQKFILKYRQFRYRNTMIQDARDVYYITNEDLDRNGNLFNCQNGTLNLTTYQLGPHNPNDLLSKISNVIYNTSARSEAWAKFISEIMLNDEGKIFYLQKMCGYALTTGTELETCFILYGKSTRNGKGTFVETLAYMMGNTGGYAMSMLPETLAQKKVKDSRQASGDIARLRGCRFLNLSEPPKRMVFDVGLLKTLLGRDTIVARHLHEREMEFIPVFKLIMNTNFLPAITDDTLFSSGRINVITFDRHFAPHERDESLKDKLRQSSEISGIFNWCLQGLKEYRYEGLEPVQAVTEATEEYRASSDKMGSFIMECLEQKIGENTRGGEVYEVYSKWCTDNGYGVENKGNFFADLKSKGVLNATGTVGGVTCRNVLKNYIVCPDCLPQYPHFQ